MGDGFTESQQAGSPVRAGIDRRVAYELEFRGGFPRTRGDRPALAPLKTCRTSFPPQAR